jgi:hypothetical protein
MKAVLGAEARDSNPRPSPWQGDAIRPWSPAQSLELQLGPWNFHPFAGSCPRSRSVYYGQGFAARRSPRSDVDGSVTVGQVDHVDKFLFGEVAGQVFVEEFGDPFEIPVG